MRTYWLGAQMTVARELVSYKLDLVGFAGGWKKQQRIVLFCVVRGVKIIN